MKGIQFIVSLMDKGTDKVKKNMADLLNQQRKASKETKDYGKVINETFNSFCKHYKRYNTSNDKSSTSTNNIF